jgi:hypothetical protein
VNTLPLRMVFSGKAYMVLAAAIAAGFWVLFGVFDQLLFIYPILDFYIPSDAYISFPLSIVTAVLLGIVLSMNVYIFKNSKVKVGASLFSGSVLSVASSACAGCTSAGFFFATTFGVAGAAASSLLIEYQLPLRLAGLALLGWAYYSAHRRLLQSCVIKPK